MTYHTLISQSFSHFLHTSYLNLYQIYKILLTIQFSNKNNMKLGRYNQSPNSYSFLQNSNKLTPRNLHNSSPKNPQSFFLQSSQAMIKLPSLSPANNSHSSIKKSQSFTSTTQRNTKNQLNLITQKLDDMQNEIHNTRMDANETLNHIRFIKQELIENRLNKDNQDLKMQIGGLKRLVYFTKEKHQNRSNQLRENYIKLWNQTQDLRHLIFSLRMKADLLEQTMGSKN